MQPVIKALAWTFVHSLWQGLAAALLAAIIISITRKSTARLRYNLLGSLLILFTGISFITFFYQLNGRHEILGSIAVTDNSSSSYIPVVQSEVFVTELAQWFNNNTGLLILVWMFFFLINCIKLFTGLETVHRLRHYKVHPVTKDWTVKFEQLQDILGIRQPVGLLQSELVKVPVAVGYLKPVILLPIGLITHMPAEQVEAILLHELGHIRRKDYLVNLLQHFAEAVFFFNPGMLWVSSLLRQEREACCDDIVLAGSHQKRSYLDALVAFQEYSMKQTSYAMAVTSRRHYLLSRVKRMMTQKNSGVSFFEKAALLAGVVLFMAFTYITKEGETKNRASRQAAAKPGVLPVNTGKVLQQNVPGIDTVPGKNDTTQTLTPAKNELRRPFVKKDQLNTKPDSDKVLQEIIRLKEEIGEKKVSIGEKKAQLKEQEGKNKDEILLKIEKERSEIEAKRSELNNKRALHEKLKEQEHEHEKAWMISSPAHWAVSPEDGRPAVSPEDGRSGVSSKDGGPGVPNIISLPPKKARI